MGRGSELRKTIANFSSRSAHEARGHEVQVLEATRPAAFDEGVAKFKDLIREALEEETEKA